MGQLPLRLKTFTRMLESILTILLSTVLGALAGYGVSRQQDRVRNRERLEGVAGALWADIRRIREELGPPRDKIIELRMFGSDPIPPEIHDWVNSLIPEVANIHPDVLLDCFHLERALHNHAVALRALRQTTDLLREAREQLRELERSREESPEGDVEGWAEDFAESGRIERRIQNGESQAELWEYSAVESRKRAHKMMGKIERHLAEFLPAERRAEIERGEGPMDKAEAEVREGGDVGGAASDAGGRNE